MVRASDGGAALLPAFFSLYHDGIRLYAAFDGTDREIVASHLAHDAPLYEEDVFELFLAPGALTRYFEIEVNPLGTTFDAVITSPDLERRTMTADLSWNPGGLWAATSRVSGPDRERSWQAVISIPFADLGVDPPGAGSTWRANAYRIDRSAAGDEYLAWRPTGRNPADFHVPEAFGSIVFE